MTTVSHFGFQLLIDAGVLVVISYGMRMSNSISCFVILLTFCAGCSRNSTTQDAGEVKQNPNVAAAISNNSDKPPTSLESLREAAEKGGALAQRELATRLLFGRGVPADPQEAVMWAKKAAHNGDPTAMLWTGRAALNEPADRIEAGAWFLIAKDGTNAAVRQDAAGELDALGLSNDELARVAARAAEMKQQFRINIK